MENSNKALIIAGSVLISILLVSTGLYVYKASSGDAVDKSAEASEKILSQATLEGVDENGNPLVPEEGVLEIGDIVTDENGLEWLVMNNKEGEIKLVLKDYTQVSKLEIVTGAESWYNASILINEEIDNSYTMPEFASEMRNIKAEDLDEVLKNVKNKDDKIISSGGIMEISSATTSVEHKFIKTDKVTGGIEQEEGSIFKMATESDPITIEWDTISYYDVNYNVFDDEITDDYTLNFLQNMGGYDKWDKKVVDVIAGQYGTKYYLDNKIIEYKNSYLGESFSYKVLVVDVSERTDLAVNNYMIPGYLKRLGITSQIELHNTINDYPQDNSNLLAHVRPIIILNEENYKLEFEKQETETYLYRYSNSSLWSNELREDSYTVNYFKAVAK